ncbi:MAG: 16S rRNA (cytosine(1402)-N(4))-methyltransferase RsmH [Synergistetes bacterium]|nr:16S rRNA (cytosine(1402)-N(4))-methyltransferase RsmH [Synergistota bacterium]MCX8127790.1 16S rRNA (cytosine(1402)-N(4))-methyltransferase RsmH [Synergistota bacterium]MDW8192052.1 16S rRNA (cytosine(1402)-N(4))-methyltransferase RsmH [Synergistota bacterium]
MHVPVMLEEVINILDPKPGDIYIDATVGLGGHAKAIAEKIFPDGLLIGIDRDNKALEIAATLLSGYNVKLIQANFRDIDVVLESQGIKKVRGVLFDLGVSSLQIDDETRGFSFIKNGPLDMRMGPDASLKAIDIINNSSLEQLVKLFKDYGEERNAYIIAKAIVERREKEKIETTLDLVEVIRKALPKPLQRKMGKHPARRVFQALRIAVNDELNSLEEGLRKSFDFLEVGGVICVISYHSLEDRIVKLLFKALCEGKVAEFVVKGTLFPSKKEVLSNPRSRSARLRAIRRVKEGEVFKSFNNSLDILRHSYCSTSNCKP